MIIIYVSIEPNRLVTLAGSVVGRLDRRRGTSSTMTTFFVTHTHPFLYRLLVTTTVITREERGGYDVNTKYSKIVYENYFAVCS